MIKKLCVTLLFFITKFLALLRDVLKILGFMNVLLISFRITYILRSFSVNFYPKKIHKMLPCNSH